MKKLKKILLLTILFIGVRDNSRGEAPLETTEQLQQGSTQVVVGRVEAIFHDTSSGSQFEKTESIAEIVVFRVDKGDGLKPGEVIYVKYWNQRWIAKRGDVPPHSRGHDGPSVGEQTIVYLEKKDGRFLVRFPNRFQDAERREAEKDGK